MEVTVSSSKGNKRSKRERQQTRRRRFFPNSNPKLAFLGCFVFWTCLSSRFSVSNSKHANDATQLKRKISCLAPTMVLSLSIPRPAMLSRMIPRRSSRLSNALQFSSLGSKSNPSTFRVYSSATTTEMDGFFEKGGDMDQMIKELAGEQQQPQELNSTEFSSSGWLQPRDITALVVKTSCSSSHDDQQASPVEKKTIRNRTVYVKHDDQLRLPGSGISGNKARKMWTLNEISSENFPPCLVSYGGPQSNSMLALAAIVNYKNRELLSSSESDTIANGADNPTASSTPTDSTQTLPVRFVYYTKKLPKFLRKQPNGNFFRALSLGMELVEVSHEEYADLFEQHAENENRPPVGLESPFPGSLWVPQGGAFPPARKGAKNLAQEIFDYWSEHGDGKALTVCVPGGTCTTALLLHHELQKLLFPGSEGDTNDEQLDWEDGETDFVAAPSILDIEVVVVPCVGDAKYARKQMMSLSAQIGASPQNIPTILQPQPEGAKENQKYFSFGTPDKAILDTFQELQDDCNLFVDLIYGAPSFAILLRHWESASSLSPDLAFDPRQPLEGREIMYVHSGGLEGINSQLLRYKYNGLVEIKDVQLPGRQNRSKPTRRGNNKKKKQ